MASRRFSCHQACESVLLNRVRNRHHHRLLVVDALDPCDGACYCLDVSRSTLPQSTLVCRSVVDASHCSSTVLKSGWWKVDLDAAVSVNVLLPRPASRPCDGTARVSASLSRHCRGQRLSVRRSLMVVQPWRQLAPPTTHARCLSRSCRRCLSEHTELSVMSKLR